MKLVDNTDVEIFALWTVFERTDDTFAVLIFELYTWSVDTFAKSVSDVFVEMVEPVKVE